MQMGFLYIYIQAYEEDTTSNDSDSRKTHEKNNNIKYDSTQTYFGSSFKCHFDRLLKP